MKYKKEQKPKQNSSSEDNPSSPTLSSCSNHSGSPNSSTSLSRTKNVSKILNEQQSIVDRLMAHSPSSTYSQNYNTNNLAPYPTTRNCYNKQVYSNYLPQYNSVSSVQFENPRQIPDLPDPSSYINNDMYPRYQSNSYQNFPTNIDQQYEEKIDNVTYSNCMYEKNVDDKIDYNEKVDYNYNPTVNVSWMAQNFGGNIAPTTLTQL